MRRKLLGAMAGVLLAGMPVAFVSRALESYIDRQIHAEVGATAHRAILRA